MNDVGVMLSQNNHGPHIQSIYP